MGYRSHVYLYHLGIRIACLLPRWLGVFIAKTLALLKFLQAKRERAIVKKNLLMAGINPNWQNVLKNFTNYAICLVDAFRALIYEPDYLAKIIDFTGKEHLDQTLKLNQGVILVTAHLGNWDLAGVYLASLGFPLTAVAEEIPGLSDVYNLIRTRTGMQIVFIQEKEKMTEALEDNRILVLLGDRDLTGRGQLVNFLNGKKKIPRGPASFALKYKSPVIFGYFVLNPDKKSKKLYRAEISEPLFPQNQTYEQFLQIVADKLSEYIRKYPLQWFVFRDEWQS
ncbi:MAG: lysophospholipid acyltransferase family protein [candidate division WOR-3 bacterium]|nr:lysophospholipid acyltransferase family protein [candidate division WOR-3 bacterium]